MDTKNTALHLGKRLRELVRAKGLTTKRIATECAVTPASVSNWFASGHISKANLTRVAYLLEVSSDDLLRVDLTRPMSGDSWSPPVRSAKRLRPREGLKQGMQPAVDQRRTYTPEALQLAYEFDHLLPDDHTRRIALALMAQLEVQNPYVVGPRPENDWPVAVTAAPTAMPPAPAMQRRRVGDQPTGPHRATSKT